MVNKKNGHGHGVWTIRVPIHRYPEARIKPLKLYRRVNEYYVKAMNADPAYGGVLTRNPMSWADRSTITSWKHKGGYGLQQLAEVVPFGWRAPMKARTGVGRMIDLFTELMKWAGSRKNRETPVLADAMVCYQRFENEGHLDTDHPFTLSEVRSCARVVERYRKGWGNRTWHCRTWIKRQQARGRKSGQTRRIRTRKRDRAILNAVLSGKSLRAVGREFGVVDGTVRHILKRDGGLFAPRAS